MDYADYLRGLKEKKENPDAPPSSVVMELRAGAGGDEAAIFARDLKEMYQKYAESRGWKTRIIDDLTLEIAGEGVYDALRYETGVHPLPPVPPPGEVGPLSSPTGIRGGAPDPCEVKKKKKPRRYRDGILEKRRGRWAEREQSRNGSAAHPQADRYRRAFVLGAESAGEPRESDANPLCEARTAS